MKPLSDFYKHIRKKYGINPQCKKCAKQYTIDNRYRLAAKRKTYYEENKTEILARMKQAYAANPERILDRNRKWAAENSKKVSEKGQRWRDNNAERARETHRAWSFRNKGRVSCYNATARSTPKGKIACMMRSAVHRRIRSPNGKCGKRTFDLLGYTVEELMASLEVKFKPGMSWENYGIWHIDHIRPVASYQFRSVDDQEFKECWSLENLQPLWAKENLSKGARYEC